jgi:hypothetical protein
VVTLPFFGYGPRTSVLISFAFIVHRPGLRCVDRLICFRRVYIIATPNKGQQVFGKRYGSFSKNMRFANENAGKKDCGFFG